MSTLLANKLCRWLRHGDRPYRVEVHGAKAVAISLSINQNLKMVLLLAVAAVWAAVTSITKL